MVAPKTSHLNTALLRFVHLPLHEIEDLVPEGGEVGVFVVESSDDKRGGSGMSTNDIGN